MYIVKVSKGHLKVKFRVIAFISLTVGDRVISSKFSTPRISKQHSLPNFQKIFKIAFISLTVGDRVISLKFSTPRVSKQYAMLTFGKFFKNGGHFEFLPKVPRREITSISLTIRDRVISLTFSTPRVSKQYAMLTFGKFLKNGGHFEF